MNKKTVVLAVIVSSVASSAFCVKTGLGGYYGNYDGYGYGYGNNGYGNTQNIKSNFNPFSKKNVNRLPGDYLYPRRLKNNSMELYNETCCDIREKYNTGHIEKAIMRVAEIIRKYAYDPQQCDKLADYVFERASQASTVGAAQFEREFLPLMNVLNNDINVRQLNQRNASFRFCDELAKKYGEKNYFPAARIVASHVVAQKLIGKGELHNLGSLGDMVFKGLENAGVIVSTRDLKKFSELGRHGKGASVSPKEAGASWMQYASIGVLPVAAVAAAILWFR